VAGGALRLGLVVRLAAAWAVMKDYVDTVMKHYAGRSGTWSTRRSNDDGSFRDNVWYRVSRRGNGLPGRRRV
jgi:hypothetical protein